MDVAVVVVVVAVGRMVGTRRTAVSSSSDFWYDIILVAGLIIVDVVVSGCLFL